MTCSLNFILVKLNLLKWSASVSENCSVLDHIPAATEERLLSTVFLLNLLTLVHHHFI